MQSDQKFVTHEIMHASIDRPSFFRVWVTALRPFSFSASVMPVLLGTGMAWSYGYPFRVSPFFLLLASVISLHAGANLLNDYFDMARGLDRQVYPVSGALVRGWLGASQVWHVALVLLGVGLLLAILVVTLSGWGLVAVALLGGLLAVSYTRKGLCLKYLGLGDPAILVAFGVLPVLAGWWVQAGDMSWVAIWWSVPSGLLAVGILHANNWRDRHSDAAHGCRTLAVRLGAAGSRLYWQGILLGALLLVPAFVLAGLFAPARFYAPVWTLLALLCVPEFAKLLVTDWPHAKNAFMQLDARMAQLHLVFTVLLCMGFLLARWCA